MENIRLTYAVWVELGEERQQLLIERIFSRYGIFDPPIGRMPEVVKYKCWRKASASKWNPYRETKTSFKSIPNVQFVYSPHNVVYFHFYGDNHSKDILHKCGLCDCIQPQHLMLGDNKENTRHASTTRKPDDINEGLLSWKTCPVDHFLAVYLRQNLQLKLKYIAKIIGVGVPGLSQIFTKILKRGSIFINKKWEKNYTPPCEDELLGWVKIILIRIKKDPELKSLFTLKDLQQMFFWSNDFDRTIAWYSLMMKKL